MDAADHARDRMSATTSCRFIGRNWPCRVTSAYAWEFFCQPKETRPVPPIQQNAVQKQTESADVILDHLTTRQHMQPHASVQDVLTQTVEMYGCCPQAVKRGIE